ncbi:MAG: hypothetical protein HUU18_09435, partial [Phycisphaerales bacterium]|nr:hypothetical protein [Phycisphaerales bacterium]
EDLLGVGVLGAEGRDDPPPVVVGEPVPGVVAVHRGVGVGVVVPADAEAQGVVRVLADEGAGCSVFDLAEAPEGVVDVGINLAVVGLVAGLVVGEGVVNGRVGVDVAGREFVGEGEVVDGVEFVGGGEDAVAGSARPSFPD